MSDLQKLTNRFRSFDIYPKIPGAYTESTLSGALVSILSLTILVALFATELDEFLTINLNSEMYVDINRSGDELQVNIDITLPRIPCDIVNVDAQDLVGTHSVNVGGVLIKNELSKEGKIIQTEVIESLQATHSSNETIFDSKKISSALTAEEGCQLQGYIIINHVPGNFHISCHENFGSLEAILKDIGLYTLDFSHRIDHLSFGENADSALIEKKFKKKMFNPLDGVSKMKKDDLQNIGVLHQYFLNIIPTTFEDLKKNKYFAYQFTSASNDINTGMIPGLYFRHSISPVTVKFSQTKTNFIHFLVQICALIGGIFTISGIIDSFLHKSIKHIIKKNTSNQACQLIKTMQKNQIFWYFVLSIQFSTVYLSFISVTKPMSSIALTEELILSKNKTSSLASVKNINFWGLEIENVDILRDMPNLEVISLSVNKINSLIKFSTCSKLTELYLRKNSISDLREVKHLCCLSNLKILWLLDNPCSECIVYRVYIIKLLPNLLKLDNTGVSLDEKKESSEYDLDKLEEIVGKFMRQKNYRDPEVSEPKIQKAVSYDQYEIVKPSKSKKNKNQIRRKQKKVITQMIKKKLIKIMQTLKRESLQNQKMKIFCLLQ